MGEGQLQEESVQERDPRSEFMEGTIDARQFLDAIFTKDQRTEARVDAGENLRVLNDPEVSARLCADTEFQGEYENARSLAAFHVAQGLLAQHDTTGAESYLSEALRAAQSSRWGEEYNGWRNYVAGTLAHVRGDTPQFEQAMGALADDQSYREALLLLKNNPKTDAE